MTTEALAGPRLEAALAYCGASLGTERADIQGQRLVEVVAWTLALPAATALVDGAPLPDLRPANVRLWLGDDPPGGDGLALRRAATYDGPLQPVLDAHLEPLIAAVNAATRRPARALERGVRDRVHGAIAWVAATTGRPERAFALLDGVVELRVFGDALVHVREGCCLYYRTTEGTKCLSCPLLDDAARGRLAAAS